MIVKVVCATGDLSVNYRATRKTAAKLCIITSVMLGEAAIVRLKELFSILLYIFMDCATLLDGEVSIMLDEDCSIDGAISKRLYKGYSIDGAVSNESLLYRRKRCGSR